MKLYGLAMAAISPEEDKNIIKVISTPIAVSDGKRTEFEIIHDLAFRTQFNLASQQGVTDYFSKTVDLIGKLVELQKESLAQNRRSYRPVALKIGEDRRKPVDKDKLYKLLFASSAEKSPFLPSSEQEQNYSADYKEACARLIPLMSECTLDWGSFCSPETSPDIPLRDLDIRLIELRDAFEKGSVEAREEIMWMAYERGVSFGKQYNGRPNAFALHVPLEGYAKDEALQKKFPSYSFYDWDPLFRKAFHTGFQFITRGNYNAHIKLPTDPDNPPFTDPCADMVTAQFEILDLKRHSSVVKDEPVWRTKIAASAKTVLTPQ